MATPRRTTDTSTVLDLPSYWSKPIKIDGNVSTQLLVTPQRCPVRTGSKGFHVLTTEGRRVPVIITRRGLPADVLALKVDARDFADLPPVVSRTGVSWSGKLEAVTPEAVLASLTDAFHYTEARDDRPGLRVPQIGALHAVLGHWTTHPAEPATVVMPTGTGKTETMVALFAERRLPRLLVVVPSDALRKQIAAKFATLGVLQTFGVIDPTASRPAVGQIDHRFSTPDAAAEFVQVCNVVVTTPNALFPARTPQVSEALLEACSHLFVDEAHHVEAQTWRQIRDAFDGKPVVQFTATPFREDARRMVGRQIYRFPLRLAQEQNYFAEIEYRSVIDLVDQDRALAVQALERLRADVAKGLDHVLMARVSTIGRAEEIQKLYDELAPDLEPVFLHSRMRVGDRTRALDAVESRGSRIIVCVDMLGEGFDMPALKVAAIHDPHKSLGITLQFVGRFARVAGHDIGQASVFVGRPDLRIDNNLRRLYAEDADWNMLISDLSESATSAQAAIGEFERGFNTEPGEVSVRSLAPKLSTVVYRTRCENWRPEAVTELFRPEALLTMPPPVNLDAGVTWFVARAEFPIRWGDLPMVEEISFHLYVVYWDRRRSLLYINSSNKDSLHEGLARAIGGADATRIQGTDVYRAMHGVDHLIPTNVGVLDIHDRDRRFAFYAGANVTEGFTDAEAQTKTQTNIFGSGFEEGERVTIGASRKGRVWSYRAAETLKHWVDWCDHVGPKLADDSIDVKAVLGSFVLPQRLTELPRLVPLAIEWPAEVALSTSDETRAAVGRVAWPLTDVELAVTQFTAGPSVQFEVRSPDWVAVYTATMVAKQLTFTATGPEVLIQRGRRDPLPLHQYFTDKSSGPLILYQDEAMVLTPGVMIQPDRERPPFDPDRLEILDWSGVNIKRESQGRNRAADTIQARMIAHVKSMADWEIILDDDGTGEVADIVALRRDDDRLHVLLVHCKYSLEPTPGARVDDLYDVCGQVQKSVQTRSHLHAMFERLIKRERDRRRRYDHDGFERGDIGALYRLADEAGMLRPTFEFAIAQPGISKGKVSTDMLQILAGSEVYIRAVAKAPLRVFCSA